MSMNKNEAFGAGLLPLMAIAGLMSGSMIRSGVRPEPPPQEQRAERAGDATAAASAPTSRYADMQPVLNLLADSMGVSLPRSAALRAAQALRLDAERAGQAHWREIADAIGALERAAQSSGAAALSDKDALAIVDSYLRTDVDPASVLHRLRAQLVDRAFEEAAAVDAMDQLTNSRHSNGAEWKVQFLIATIPDYVDSNSGWVADETLGAIQSAMDSADIVLDRFRLIDWSRADDGRASAAPSDSTLHERQPGALVFRHVVVPGQREVTLQVVLLVLETPTTGVHRLALRNAMKFVRDRSSKVDRTVTPELKVIGPVFSGSVASLAQE
jgi:hypothetical protein